MKRILSIMWLLTCMTVGAYAQGDTLTISTATYCGVQVSTSAATRVDNKVTGGGTAVMNSRTHLKVCTKADNPTVFCGFDVNVSTQNTVNMGQAIPGSIYVGGMALCN